MFKIVGKEVRLRFATPDDAEQMLRAMDQLVLKNFSFFAQGRVTLERQKAYLEKMCRSEQDILFCVERNLDRQIIGTCGLHELDGANRNARMGVMLLSLQDRGKGYGTEARHLLLAYAFAVEHSDGERICKPKLHKVYARFKPNPSAAKKYEKEGFIYEGVMREEYRTVDYLGNERFEDMESWSILARDWAKRQ